MTEYGEQCSVADAGFRRLITFARKNLIFLLFAFLIDDGKRAAVRSDQFHLYLVEFTVFRSAGGGEGKAVLVTEKSRDAAENVGNFAVELRKPRESACFLRKRPQLILSLQIIHIGTHVALAFEIVGPGLTQADAKDRDVATAKRFHGLVESVLGKGVHAAGKQ